ncbi:inositol-trisphosphate 3-kinase A-like [Babylonia areolata]|uniref:inositol-trisphosphate 3-kinase A-like n=1 Tax=Babylonia areolata TaxID=304850 RepID=UPI003FD159C2
MIDSADQPHLNQPAATPTEDSCTPVMGRTPSGDAPADSNLHHHTERCCSHGGGGGEGEDSSIQDPRRRVPHSPATTPGRDGDSGSSSSSPSGKPAFHWSSSMLQPISEEEVLDLMEGRNLQEIMSSMPPCQCDACLFGEGEEGEEGGQRDNNNKPPLKRQSSWKKIRSIVRWAPFIQVFKKHRYPWIQLAGHQGNFQAGEAGCVLKKLDTREHQSLQRLMDDPLQCFVPQLRGVTHRDGHTYIQLQDLLCEFSAPCVMDVKMGLRTFLEAEILAAKHNPALRKDMYQKMVEVDPGAPTEEEHGRGAVSKHRYMQWRDTTSSSASLGFRIEGVKDGDGGSNKDFKKTKTREHVTSAFRNFLGHRKTLVADYLQRLQDIAKTQESSDFFRSHELIGSSLLFVHDDSGAVGVWMIDFGKTQPLPGGVAVTHRAGWLEGNHEDGYLLGLDNIVSILQDLLAAFVE